MVLKIFVQIMVLVRKIMLSDLVFWSRSQRKLILMIVFGVLVGSVLLGFRVQLIYLMIIIGGMMGVVLFRFPQWGMLFIPVASMLIPFQIETGTQTNINITILLLMALFGIWLLDALLIKRCVSLTPSPMHLSLFILCVVTLLAFLNGQLPWFTFASQVSLPAQIGGVIVFLFSAVAFWLVGTYFNQLRWLSVFVWLFLGVSGLYMFGRVLNLGLITVRFVPGSTGSVFWVLVVALAFSQAFFNRQLQIELRLGLFVLGAVTLIIGWISRDWASGYIPGLATLGVLIWLCSWRWGLFMTIGVLLFVLVFNPDFVPSLLYADQYSVNTRGDAADILIKNIISVQPFLGFGPANYYNYSALFPIRGYYVRFNSHNQYLDLLAQVGLLGTICYLWFFGSVMVNARRLFRTLPPGFGQAYAAGILSLAVGLLVCGLLGDWVLPYVYNIGLAGMRSSVVGWMFMGGLVVLANQVNPNPLVRES